MKSKFIATLLCAALASASLIGCGDAATGISSDAGAIKEEASGDENPEGEELTPAEGVAKINELQAGDHDASEKENTFAADLEAAQNASEGSGDTFDGKYHIKLTDGTVVEDNFYAFLGDKYSIVTEGTYSFDDDGKITIDIPGLNNAAYDITETTTGFNLSTEDGTLLPLVYMEGTDGLVGTENFDGVYSMGESTGYIFHKDGTMETVITDNLEVKKKKLILGDESAGTYEWKKTDEGLEVSTNGTVLEVFVPTE